MNGSGDDDIDPAATSRAAQQRHEDLGLFVHRVLVFAQHRKSLDLVEQLLLDSHPKFKRLP
jgi:SNF2 family DNA or RNA helicase